MERVLGTVLDQSVQSIEDLKPNMVHKGTITNLTHFGAFVDIGIHQDGWSHISQLAQSYVTTRMRWLRLARW